MLARLAMVVVVFSLGCGSSTVPEVPELPGIWNVCEQLQYSRECRSWRWDAERQVFIQTDGVPGVIELQVRDNGSVELSAQHENGWQAEYTGRPVPGGFRGMLEATGESGAEYIGSWESRGELPENAPSVESDLTSGRTLGLHPRLLCAAPLALRTTRSSPLMSVVGARGRRVRARV